MFSHWTRAWSASGAGLHLQKRGRDVILVDKHSLASEETSYCNGRLIERRSETGRIAGVLRYVKSDANDPKHACASS
jgi:hypothetical protein